MRPNALPAQRWWLAAAVGCSCLAVAGVARSADPPTRWEAGTLVAEANFGLGGSPVGILGATVDLSAAKWISGYLGTGIGGAGGIQFATGLRLRAQLTPAVMVGIAPGLSGGHYSRFGFFESGKEEWKSAGWANVDAFLDVRMFPRVTFRPFLGYSRMLDPASAQRINKDTGEPVAGKVESGSVNLPYFGIAIGYVILP